MNDCYGWDEELQICLLYGIVCDGKAECYHKTEEERT